MTFTIAATRAAAAIGSGLALLALATTPIGASAQTKPPASSATPDFDAAMRGLRFDPATVDGNLDGSGRGNGILDADEMALVGAILGGRALDLRGSGGVDAKVVRAAFDQALATASADLRSLLATYPTAADVVAGYAMLGRGSFDSYNKMTTSFGAPLTGDYSLALQLGRYLAHDGDADGDGVSNQAEYAAQIGQGRAAYLRAALDPTIRTTAVGAKASPPAKTQKTLGIVLYPGFEVLDVFGPLEMWAYVPEFKVVMIAEKAGPVRSAQGVSAVADYSFETAPPLDIMMVPGGIGTRTELGNPVFLDYLREQNKRTELTTSVCTGSALLARAGILKGFKATSNKAFFSLATDQDPDVNWIAKARWVEDGKFITSSGVSAGTDMALGMISRLYGKERARILARSLEYEWHEDPDVDPFARNQPPRALKP